MSKPKDLPLFKEADMAYMRLKGDRWYLCKKVQGKYKGFSLNAHKDDLATAYKNLGVMLDRLERGDDPSTGKKKLNAVPYTPKSERERGIYQGPLLAWFGGMRIRDIDDDSILDYVASRKGIAKSTLQKELRVLKNICQEGKKKLELPQIAYANKGKRITRALTTDQVKKVLGYVRGQSQEFGAQYEKVFKIMVWSGMDSKDVVFLRWEFIGENWIRRSRFKSGEPMDAPICGPLAQLFKGMVRNIDGRLFHGFGSKAACTAIQRAFADAGVPGSGKALRHYYASMMASGGASESAVGHALGHKKGSRCTALYIHTFEADLEKAVTVFDREAL